MPLSHIYSLLSYTHALCASAVAHALCEHIGRVSGGVTEGLSVQGCLRSVEILPTRQLPLMSAEASVGFNPWQQIHFGNDVLTWMRHMTGAQPSRSGGLAALHPSGCGLLCAMVVMYRDMQATTHVVLALCKGMSSRDMSTLLRAVSASRRCCSHTNMVPSQGTPLFTGFSCSAWLHQCHRDQVCKEFTSMLLLHTGSYQGKQLQFSYDRTASGHRIQCLHIDADAGSLPDRLSAAS